VEVYHDENVNLELDRNFLGIPREIYGFSNNPKGEPVEWVDALFTLDYNNKVIEIKLRSFPFNFLQNLHPFYF
jgi:uncharacterized protein (DUF2141 family)